MPTAKQTEAAQKNLVPFGKDEESKKRASEAGRKGGLARARNAEAKKLEVTDTAKAWKLQLDMLADTFNREELGSQAANVASMLLGKIASGAVEISGKDMASLLDTLVNIVRLEEGKATSHTASVSLAGGDVLNKIAALREKETVGGSFSNSDTGRNSPPQGDGAPGGGTEISYKNTPTCNDDQIPPRLNEEADEIVEAVLVDPYLQGKEE